jgi:hypothetical protein
MKSTLLVLIVLFALSPLKAADLLLTAPADFQVIQRSKDNQASLQFTGELSAEIPAGAVVIEARLEGSQQDAPWLRVEGGVAGRALQGTVIAPAGGWWRLEVRVSVNGVEFARGAIPHVGIGELFVVAGQSNSANHGEERQTPKSGRVATRDGHSWRLAADPQPGASGEGGSFMPPLGDAIVAQEDVPVGFIACGIGATSVREWLPRGARFPNPPTIESRVERQADGHWTSKGEAYGAFIARIRPLGKNGFRAVLWHQGESDANQQDSSRTLEGSLYRDYLERLIRDARRDLGWEVPWFVAQASYHVPGDEGSEEIRAAQSSLWRDGIALQGPDSDALKGPLRENNGQGVHFSGPGLREHAAKWADQILPWLEQSREPR